MISLEEAQARVASDISRLDPVLVPLADTLGLTLAKPVLTKEAIPPFANTAMDGFAIRSQDSTGAEAAAESGSPVTLPVVATIPAGSVASKPLGPGEAMRIMTGAPIPEGADAIIMVELTRPAAGQDVGSPSTATQIELLARVVEGNHIRPAGDDVGEGVVVLAEGEVVSPGHLGVLASVGLDQVLVYKRPRIGVFSTGDELVSGPAPLEPGQIRDSNRPTLLGLVKEAGCIPIDLGSLPDDEAEIEAALRAAVGPQATQQCDALITSGGVSMGDFDFVKKVLARLGDLNWMQVAIKPAKPLAFGLLLETPIFGLPGNPVSSMVSFELFARPALMAMMGKPQHGRRQIWAVSDEGIQRTYDGKTHYVRVIATPESDGAWRVRSAGGQGSHQLTSMARANALAVVPDGTGVKVGGRVRVMLLE